MARVLVSFGAIFLSFGITFAIIEVLASLYGTRHSLGVTLAIVTLIVGAVLAGAGTAMGRSHSRRSANG